jgi:hypothetical protein
MGKAKRAEPAGLPAQPPEPLANASLGQRVAAYLAEHGSSPQAAHDELQKLGIVRADGRLTKPYR